MKKNLSKFEVLYDDLIHHSIGSYFKSRDFKVFLTSANAITFWNSLCEEASNQRTFYSLGMDVEKYDSEEAFKDLIYLSIKNDKIRDLLIDIISNFIENYSKNNNFSNVIQSLKISGFSDSEIKKVENSIEIFNSKSFKKDNVKVSNIVESSSLKKETTLADNMKKVFIVHGHNNHLKVEVARTLEKLKLQPIILHEQTNNGKTIIEKFEKFSDVSFAIILLTADDLGNSKDIEQLNKRARQNVVFELGYFIGKLGRENVMTLKEEGVEVPNDISGVVYTPFDSHGNWKTELARELKSAGFEVDMNNLF